MSTESSHQMIADMIELWDHRYLTTMTTKESRSGAERNSDDKYLIPYLASDVKSILEQVLEADPFQQLKLKTTKIVDRLNNVCNSTEQGFTYEEFSDYCWHIALAVYNHEQVINRFVKLIHN